MSAVETVVSKGGKVVEKDIVNLIELLMNHLFHSVVVIHSVFESIVWIGVVGVCSRNCVFERGKVVEKNLVNLIELLMMT